MISKLKSSFATLSFLSSLFSSLLSSVLGSSNSLIVSTIGLPTVSGRKINTTALIAQTTANKIKNCQFNKNSSKKGAKIDPAFPKVALIPKARLLTGVGYISIE